jgi:hypothetical protein
MLLIFTGGEKGLGEQARISKTADSKRYSKATVMSFGKAGLSERIEKKTLNGRRAYPMISE